MNLEQINTISFIIHFCNNKNNKMCRFLSKSMLTFLQSTIDCRKWVNSVCNNTTLWITTIETWNESENWNFLAPWLQLWHAHWMKVWKFPLTARSLSRLITHSCFSRVSHAGREGKCRKKFSEDALRFSPFLSCVKIFRFSQFSRSSRCDKLSNVLSRSLSVQLSSA